MEPKAVADRYYEALRRNDVDGVVSTLDPQCEAEVPGATLDGREQVREWMGSFFDAFPDITHSIGDLEVRGQTVSANVRVTGTHSEPFVTPRGTIPPTGRAIEIRARNEMDVRDDLIAVLRITFDAADFMRQLGLG